MSPSLSMGTRSTLVKPVVTARSDIDEPSYLDGVVMVMVVDTIKTTFLGAPPLGVEIVSTVAASVMVGNTAFPFGALTSIDAMATITDTLRPVERDDIVQTG